MAIEKKLYVVPRIYQLRSVAYLCRMLFEFNFDLIEKFRCIYTQMSWVIFRLEEFDWLVECTGRMLAGFCGTRTMVGH